MEWPDKHSSDYANASMEIQTKIIMGTAYLAKTTIHDIPKKNHIGNLRLCNSNCEFTDNGPQDMALTGHYVAIFAFEQRKTGSLILDIPEAGEKLTRPNVSLC